MSEFFTTSDGEQFYTENHAYNHARSLKDKTVTPPTMVAEKEEESDTTPVVELSKMTKKELIQFAEISEIKINPKDTNAEIIEAIQNALAVKSSEGFDEDDTDGGNDWEGGSDSDNLGNEGLNQNQE